MGRQTDRQTGLTQTQSQSFPVGEEGTGTSEESGNDWDRVWG